MTKPRDDQNAQLVLNFERSSDRYRACFDPAQTGETTPTVVAFVDAGTLAARRSAIRRVQNSRIFAISERLKP